jgi:hypothetical protein
MCLSEWQLGAKDEETGVAEAFAKRYQQGRLSISAGAVSQNESATVCVIRPV